MDEHVPIRHEIYVGGSASVREVLERVELGNRLYTISRTAYPAQFVDAPLVFEGETERREYPGVTIYGLSFHAMRNGETYGPGGNRVILKTDGILVQVTPPNKWTPQETRHEYPVYLSVETAKEGIAAHAKKAGPYKAKGRYADKLRAEGKLND